MNCKSLNSKYLFLSCFDSFVHLLKFIFMKNSIQSFIQFFLFLFYFNFSFGQISLQETDFANPNDTVRYSQAMDQGIDFSTTGPNNTWNFSSLTSTGQYVKNFNPIGFGSILVQATFGFFAPQNYQASYFTQNTDLPVELLSTFLPVSVSDLNAYTHSSSSKISSIGYSLSVNSQAVPFKSDTIETRYSLPLDYNDSYNSRGYTLVDFNPVADFKFKQHRQRSSVVDGWGSLILPNGTYNVLRLKHQINEIDSIYLGVIPGFPATWIGTPPIQTVEYEWIGESKKDVLLKIVTSITNGTEQVQSIDYQDSYSASGLYDQGDGLYFSLVPNPAENKLTITSSSSISDYEIYDITGKLISQKNSIDVSKLEIDISELLIGSYFISLNSENTSKKIKFIKL